MLVPTRQHTEQTTAHTSILPLVVVVETTKAGGENKYGQEKSMNKYGVKAKQSEAKQKKNEK